MTNLDQNNHKSSHVRGGCKTSVFVLVTFRLSKPVIMTGLGQKNRVLPFKMTGFDVFWTDLPFKMTGLLNFRVTKTQSVVDFNTSGQFEVTSFITKPFFLTGFGQNIAKNRSKWPVLMSFKPIYRSKWLVCQISG